MEKLTTRFFNPEELPLVVEPKDHKISIEVTLELLRENEQEIKSSLLKYGGILFRNFPINSVDDFTSVIETMKTGKFLNYIGGDSPRDKITQKVYTSSPTIYKNSLT